MSDNRSRMMGLLAATAMAILPLGVSAQEKPAAGAASPAEGELQAQRLVEKAQELLAMKEDERGVKMLESVLDQYPKSSQRQKVFLILGRHSVEREKYADAIRYLRGVTIKDEKKEGEVTPEERDRQLEAQYLTGVAYFHLRQYGNAFTVLRTITRDHPNTVWANQSYYYIGMCHFALQNWKSAIEALTMVGTHVDPNSPASQRAEANRRLYVKVTDADLPILLTMNKEVAVELTTKNGDKEKIICVPIAAGADAAIGSIPTEAGVAKPGDNILQAVGSDEVTARYLDEVNAEGKNNVPHDTKVQVVSTGNLRFTMGTYEDPAIAAFVGQPAFVLLEDMDKDTSPQADKIAVRVISRYKAGPSDESALRAVNTDDILADEASRQYVVRDEVTAELTELGEAPVHTGRFGGQVKIAAFVEGAAVDKNDPVLACALDDEIIATYPDEKTIEGDTKKDVQAKIVVIGELDGRPVVTQNIVNDPVIKARKQLVEATAYLELTRIFRSMGLMKKAIEKANEGIDRAQGIILARSAIPGILREQAFKIKWELYIAIEDYPNAIATCALFSKLFPTSSYADEALMQIGVAKVEAKKTAEGIAIFRQVLSLPNSRVKPEAQFRIAEAMFAEANDPQRQAQAVALRGQAMQEYKQCADQFPDSEFAGKSLARLVDYYVETKDYVQADDMLAQIFQDYPDAPFRDSMLLKWVIVCYNMGNFDKALEKCNQLIFDYPDSEFAAKAKPILAKLEQKVKPVSEGK